MRRLIVSILIYSLLIISCRDNVQPIPNDVLSAKREQDDKLVKMNNYVVKRNQELIERFVSRTGLKMSNTGSGLWYGIYLPGEGKQVEKGDRVEISYTLRLLDGTIIDSVSSAKPKSFTVGTGGVEPGIEEGILLLHEGDHVYFIIPPHLAYGNFGDRKRVPPGAFLFYDLYLARIKSK